MTAGGIRLKGLKPQIRETVHLFHEDGGKANTVYLFLPSFDSVVFSPHPNLFS
jgi:hypothetical protein